MAQSNTESEFSMSDTFEIEEDDSTVTFTDTGDALPVENDPIKALTQTILALRNELEETKLDLAEARASRDFAVAHGFKNCEERDNHALSLMRQVADLKADNAVKNNAIDHLTVALDTANRKLAQVAGLHDLLERLTISADDRARKNAMEIVVSDVKHLDWNTADLKLQASLQLGLSEAYDRTNAAICDILAGATSWEEDNWS